MVESINNKRIIKNALALAFRMVLVTVVGLFTTRVVLQALGVDDYGIYGVIGGVVGMASFLNSSMAGATSRFITFELGRGDYQKLKTIFSTALIIHFIIAICVVILAETIGLWFVNNHMNFPADRMVAVNVIYQFTIISMVVNFTQVPYSAEIIAHERMSIYAYIEIISTVLKLGIVYLLLIIKTDKLIFYAGLLLAVNILIMLFYRFYCVRNFSESRFSLIFDKVIIREMLKFSGMDLYGNMCAVAKSQGQPIILNMFYGVVANAGASIAFTIISAITGFTGCVLQAFRPQIIKQYSAGRVDLSENVAKRAIQFSLLVSSLISIPLIIETPLFLGLWLGEIPEYSVIFTRIIIVSCIINVVIGINNVSIHATGNIKNISFVSGTLFLLSLIISYFYLKLGGGASSIYVIGVFTIMVVAILGVIFIKKQIPGFDIKDYVRSICKSLLVLILSLLLVSIITNCIDGCMLDKLVVGDQLGAFLKLISCVIITIAIVSVSFWTIVFERNDRKAISNVIRGKLRIKSN